MIVACSACHTRFRVADEKVGPLGARVKCSRCGQTFSVAPPPPPEPTEVSTEPTGTGGWPTGALEVAGASASDTVSSVGLALEADPFAAFATRSAPAAPPPPPPSPKAAASAADGFSGSLPVTDLSDLERTAPAPAAPPLPPEPEQAADDGLALEDRTPSATPLREAAARWSDPEASQSIEVGPDGFQEVDLARGEARPDPAFDSMAGEGTNEAPLPPLPPPVETARSAAPAAPPEPEAGPDPAAAAPPSGPAPAVRIAPARIRALAMNVVSLAALLLVTLGIVLWWRGEGMGAILRWPRAGQADLDVGGITSGVYEGSHGQPVVFVRGVVRATHEPVDGPVMVQVFLERRGAVLGGTTATAGSVPSAEDLAEIKSPDDLKALLRRLDSRAPGRIEPGGDLPFLAVMPLPEGDVGAIRFRVEPVPVRRR